MAIRKSSSRRGRGTLVAIGGHETRTASGAVLQRFIEEAGGTQAKILIIGAALEDSGETTAEYATVFRRIGAASAVRADIADREAAQSPHLLDQLNDATAVFCTGGDQLLLVSLIAGTTFGEQLREAHESKGLVVGGTSAGAAAMAGTMIIGGPKDETVRRRAVEMAPGLGFWRDAVVDTHFAQRGRVNRIFAIFAENPQVIGIGLDEDTGVVVRPGRDFEVVGTGACWVFDGRVSHTNVSTRGEDETIAVTDSRVHVLPCGYGFDLRTKRPRIPKGN